MRKRLLLLGLVLVLVGAAALVAAGCGEEETTTSTAPQTTAAPSTETTAAPSTETTAAPSTETTQAGPATGEPIKVGLITSLTGPSAAPGVSVKQGAELQVEYVNANGGINGRPLELIVKDDGSDVAGMVNNLTQLIQDVKIDYFVGPFIQYGQEAARDMCEQAQVPMVGAGPVTLEQLKAKKRYNWSVMVSAGPIVAADANIVLIKAHGFKNILAFGDILTIHQDTLDLLVQKGPSEGFACTKMPDTFGLDQQDFQPLLNRVLEEYNKLKPDAVFASVNPIAAPAIHKGLVALGVKVPIVGSAAAAHPAIFAMGPEAVEGMYVTDSGGLVNPAGLPDDFPVKQLQLDFFERYQAKYGQAPDFFAAVGTDFIIVLEAALKQSGAPEDKEKVRQALINLKNVPAMEGIVNFAPDKTDHGIDGNTVEWQVKGAQFNFVRVLN
ncbi:MAG: ABC transporter substrate-binding protein [Thermoleophilia bacterium]|nr:ABC transporter substrate-binding protein [Thermoleophilia bacterium]